jgi:UDP-GlcNAc:undecaprenyl-phosphate GlcNAc-1-phosphate transferase
VPYLGGVAIVVAFSLVVLAASAVLPTRGQAELAVTLGLAVILAGMGLVDDLRGLTPWFRLGMQVLAGIALWIAGSGVSIFTTEPLNVLLTVVWVVGITNAFNFLDNMDGLSAGVAVIGATSFFVIAAVNGQVLVAALAIALAGCALGFLRHNFHPARIYMGDAGSLFLGFLLAVIGVKLRFDGPTEVTFFVPILVLGVAILDMLLVTITRITNGKSPLRGGRDHTSHRLVFIGIPVPGAVSLIYGSAVGLGWLALIMSRVDRATGFLLMAFVVAVGVFLSVLLAVVPVYGNSKRRRMMIQEVALHVDEAAA